MDHLLPTAPNCTSLEVPYLHDESCPFEYDNGDWEGYPERVSWDLKTFLDSDFTNKGRNTPHQAASFLQAWLYFGIIHAITGIPVNTRNFVQDNARGIPVVTTKELPRYISAWKEIISGWSKQHKQNNREAIDTIFKKVTETISLYIGWRTPLSNEVILAIMILHKTLIYSKNILMNSDYEPRTYYYQESRELIDAELYKRGWCKRDVAKHHQAHSCLTMYFAISLGPRLVSRDHTKCSQTECLALQVDETTYVTQHTKLGCYCKNVSVETEQLVSIIENGMTPLVRLSQLPDAEGCSLDIVTNSEYVCISHVWSDGLGNPHDNALPKCQLELLQTQVNALWDRQAGGENIPFWVDSLCIPVKPEYAASRSKAIASMSQIYKGASKVLVLDAELQKASCKVSAEEIALRVSYSVWWSRLWTLQEGLFARELWFQFRDGLRNGMELIEQNERAKTLAMASGWNIPEQICFEGLGYLRELYSFSSEHLSSRASYILQAVNWRSSSKTSDEPICLGTLFDLDVKEILRTPADDRLKKFILMQRIFPSVSLFFSGRKMDEDGFRWAPKTFAFSRAGLLPAYQRDPDHGSGRLTRQTSLAIADKSGLHVQFFGFRLEPFTEYQAIDGEILFRDRNTQVYYTFRCMRNTTSSPFKDLELKEIPNLAIVLPGLPSGNIMHHSVLVSVYREEDGELFSRFVSRVSIHNWGSRDLMSIRLVLGLENPRPIPAIGLSEEQKWCVG